jgi:CHAT domain-containing protein
VTREPQGGSRGSGACPDPGLIAAHAERRLTGDEAVRLDEHIAGCAACYEVFAETLQFGLTEAEGGEVVPPRAAWSATVRRPKLLVGLAMAATVLLALALWQYRGRVERPAAPIVAELAEALGTRRFIEPRLTGGFHHGRLTALRSGETSRGLDAQPAAVLAAVARIRERAEGDSSPAALEAVGITYLVSGDVDAAVKALESASAQQPENARLWSDLAAAYLVRAKQAEEPQDFAKALEATERAIALPDATDEAYFNRALALEGLHLVEAARKAWQDYLQRDAASGWAEEARQHLEALPAERQSSAETDGARVRAALEEGAAATDRLAEEAPQLLRDHLQNELLPAWAEAYLVGHPDAKLRREQARLAGDALSRTTGDTLIRDAARALGEPEPTATSRDPPRSQALGYRALREASRLYDRQEPSCAPFRRALRDLEEGGSPYAAWARLQTVSACLFPSEPKAALAELGRVRALAEPRGYVQLLGRARWLEALIHAFRGELTDSLEFYRSARAAFHAIRDAESEAAMAGMLAENLRYLGETRGAWHDRGRSLALLGEVKSPRRRQGILGEATLACLGERMPRSALHFGTAQVETAIAWSRPAAISDALISRAGIHHSLGADDRARADLSESRRWGARISDTAIFEKQAAETSAAEGEVLLHEEPERAAESLGLALAYFRASAPARVPALQLLLARAQIARGLDEAAEDALAAGIRELERQRASLRDDALQLSFFEQAGPAFAEMVRLQVTKRHDPERALAFAERGRARQLVDSLRSGPAAPLDPEAIRRQLPDGLALVYYVALEDRLLAWALTREETRFVERPLPSAELARLVTAYRTALERRARLEIVQQQAARLYDELVRPLAPVLGAARTLVLVPDGVLQPLAFASLWDRQTGRYLLEDHLVGLAPSGTVFVQASAAAAANTPGLPSRALVVGNPQLDRRIWADLPRLPAAEAEATDVARLYEHAELLTGGVATKAAFLGAVEAADVVHFAGHATTGAEAPFKARLLFAPDRRTGDSGTLQPQELGRRGLPRTRVVVLAACRTAAGTVSRVEGALSLGRPFLAAGVPSVVASLWDIDDAVSRSFFVAFHRALVGSGDPLQALRQAQLALLHETDPSLAHPASWAAFVCMGGARTNAPAIQPGLAQHLEREHALVADGFTALERRGVTGRERQLQP